MNPWTINKNKKLTTQNVKRDLQYQHPQWHPVVFDFTLSTGCNLPKITAGINTAGGFYCWDSCGHRRSSNWRGDAGGKSHVTGYFLVEFYVSQSQFYYFIDSLKGVWVLTVTEGEFQFAVCMNSSKWWEIIVVCIHGFFSCQFSPTICLARARCVTDVGVFL